MKHSLPKKGRREPNFILLSVEKTREAGQKPRIDMYAKIIRKKSNHTKQRGSRLQLWGMIIEEKGLYCVEADRIASSRDRGGEEKTSRKCHSVREAWWKSW